MGLGFSGIMPSYIEEGDNRDVYQLYETNFDNSFKQKEYVLNVRFFNIKNFINSNLDKE